MASELNLQMTTAQQVADRRPKHRSDHYALLHWNDLPSWQQDNGFILSGYRQASGSFRESLNSLQHIHNEVVNIYSHLLGAVLFAALPIYVCVKVRNHAIVQVGDIIGFAVFFFGATFCFFLSAFFHIMSNRSEKVAARWNQLDYLGIVILIWGSIVPSVYYGFYCDPNLQKLYWTLVSVQAAVCTIATLIPKFPHPTFRKYRTAIYASLGLLAMAFITHGLLIHGWEIQNHRMSLIYIFITVMLNLLGAVIYTARIPERWDPLRYDIYGCSHQIFHFIVVFAGLIHMFGLLSAFDYIHSHSCA